jgi:hypothetical protein
MITLIKCQANNSIVGCRFSTIINYCTSCPDNAECGLKNIIKSDFYELCKDCSGVLSQREENFGI